MGIFASIGISLGIGDFNQREVKKELYNKSEAIKALREAYRDGTATSEEFIEGVDFLINSPDNSLYSIIR